MMVVSLSISIAISLHLVKPLRIVHGRVRLLRGLRVGRHTTVGRDRCIDMSSFALEQ